MMLFALVISISLAITNYVNHKSDAINNERRIIEEKINLLRYALDTSERANMNIDKNISEQMEFISSQLQTLYQENANIEQWDLDTLSLHYGSDIYIIDEQNVILYSNVAQDIGLNFNLCCSTLAKILDDRRNKGGFYVDGFDLEQSTGNIKSYSYMATADRKYIIQLGLSWDNNPLFTQFNFLNTINRLKESTPLILEINVLNLGGLSYGKSENEFTLEENLKEAFAHTLETGEDTSYEGEFNNQLATFYFSQYNSEIDPGTSQTKVIELVYSKSSLQTVLNKHKEAFIFQVFIILLVTTILSLLLSRWISKPIYMAFHDSLTALGNRAYFEEYVQIKYTAPGKPYILIMIDVDNFKQVNDTLGHESGDKLLKQTAKMMRDMLQDGEFIFRLGGDEFMIVIPNNQARAKALAISLLGAFHDQIASKYELSIPVSLSIGISSSNEHYQDIETVMRHADKALYSSKKQGKNTYSY